MAMKVRKYTNQFAFDPEDEEVFASDGEFRLESKLTKILLNGATRESFRLDSGSLRPLSRSQANSLNNRSINTGTCMLKAGHAAQFNKRREDRFFGNGNGKVGRLSNAVEQTTMDQAKTRRHGHPKWKIRETYVRIYWGSGDKLKQFIRAYLGKDNLKEYNPLHLRRTLDQYCYYSPESTEDRDKDQLLSRILNSQRSKPRQIAIDRNLYDTFKDNNPILMVDQLWLWVLEDNTVITCFPKRWSYVGRETDSNPQKDDPEPDGRTDVFNNVIRNSHNVDRVESLVYLIIEECQAACFDDTRYLDTCLNILEIYKDEVDQIINEETMCFRTFSTNVSHLEGAKLSQAISNNDDSLNISEEIKLLREIKDIRDELHTIGLIFEHQLEILKSIGEFHQSRGIPEIPIGSTGRYLKEVQDIDKHTEDAYMALNNLLDLKQKLANVAEARWSRGQAEETARQGNTLLVFTVVTIVFLPLSFMAAFFALNVAEFPKTPSGSLHLDFVTKYIFSISAAVVIPLLLLAFNVNSTTKTYDFVAKQLKKKYIQYFSKEHADSMSSKGPTQIRTIQFVSYLVTYLFLILPISEVQFVCKLLKEGWFLLGPASEDRSIQSPGPVDDRNEIGHSQGWKVRSIIKVSVTVAITAARILLVPVWVSLLCIEASILILLSLLGSLLFEVDLWKDFRSWAKASGTSLAARGGHCPPLGPVLPAPLNPGSHSAVKAAMKTIQEHLEAATSKHQNSSVVVAIKSANEHDYLLEFANTPPNVDPRGVDKVDSDTVFRMASLSKVFPVLALLKLHKVNFDDAVTKYLPELRALNKQARKRDAVWAVDWDEVTIGALASHIGGVPADMATDVAPYGDWTKLGFPEPDPSKSLNCSGILGLPACTKKDFFDRFGERPPVYGPFSVNPVYSNTGWALMGMVIEKVTGMPSGEFIKKNIWDPTGMKNTYDKKPDDSLGFIPPNDEWWNATLGYGDPAGVYYTSLNDIMKFGDALLRNKLLSPVQMRKWLKPATGTSSRGILLGEPWEIFRTNNVTKDGRLIDFYTKAGDITTYHSLMVLIPDYNLTVSLFNAGPEVGGLDLQFWFTDIVKELLPAIEEAGKDEADKIYGGTYSDKETNSTLTLSVDDQSGFHITNWTVRGVDIAKTYRSIDLPPKFPTPPGEVRFRLYPTDLKTDTETSWRMLSTSSEEEVKQVDSRLAWPDGSCNTWASVDRIVYQLLAHEHFVFTESSSGSDRTVVQLELVGYRVNMTKDN
ncbi:Beta-lactamase-like protein 2 [Fusarium austroafricanum]|uniref:Beta-lactamase-like protein 2 n=1 Tax=Fusarium austroafricanum TaxID=2364996 RepID=A0A8H4NZC2_9HYPO|nr:Beta-lactamase-like protein 2 [Fusarium austroafricanum]